jgi:hypothetical protein
MIQLHAAHFPELCAAQVVRERMEAIEGERRIAVRKFWTRGLLGLVLTAAVLLSLLASGWDTVAIVAAVIFLIGTIMAAAHPLSQAKEGLKLPVLDEIAKRSGMEYLADDFTPPVYHHARALLFGGGMSSETFTDLFHGADDEGRGYAVFEGCLQRRVGKNTQTIFSGQMYGIHRRPGGKGITVIVPDRKIFNFFKPARDMERVPIEGDEAFERRFEVYSTEPMEARQLLFDSTLRARLLALREGGKLLAYIAPEEALLAISGKDRFEPGSMFRSRPGEERVRLMFDDVCASLDLLRELKAKLG